MARQWTPEQKAKQAALIRNWQPWQQSTGAKTEQGKANSALNACKGYKRVKRRKTARVFRDAKAMLDLVENFDEFRGCSFYDHECLVSSTCNNKYSRELMHKNIFAIRKAKNGGHAQSIQRILSFIPLTAQSYSESPYFDLDLFSFDEKIISPLERYFFLFHSSVRLCHDYAVKFYCRKTGKLKWLDERKRRAKQFQLLSFYFNTAVAG